MTQLLFDDIRIHMHKRDIIFTPAVLGHMNEVICVSICMSISMSICMSVCMSIYMSTCMSIYMYNYVHV